jgi:hypothetical protein
MHGGDLSTFVVTNLLVLVTSAILVAFLLIQNTLVVWMVVAIVYGLFQFSVLSPLYRTAFGDPGSLAKSTVPREVPEVKTRQLLVRDEDDFLCFLFSYFCFHIR